MHLLSKRLGIGLSLGVASAFMTVGISSCSLFQSTPNTPETTTPTSATVQTVTVGVNLPLTGELGAYGKGLQDSALMARDDLKASNQLAATLKFDWQDNAGDPKKAVTVFQKQFLDQPNVYVSGFTPQTLAINSLVEAKGTPHIVWAFDAFITRDSKTNFRTWINYKIEPPIYFEFIKARKPKKVVILYANVSYGAEEINKIVVPELKALGVQDVLVEPYEVSLKDFKDLALKVKEFQPDALILNGFPFTLVSAVRALRPLGVIKDGNTIGTYDMINAGDTLGADEVEGIRVVAPTYMLRPTQKYLDWSKRFVTKFGRQPSHPDAYAYDMTIVLNDVAKRVKQPASPAQWVEAIKSTNTEGVTGPLSFDQDKDLKTPIEIGVFRKGKLVPEKE
ncbi:ABC transporter substrate-binding protein [Pseudanabaena sp. UWO310]|uniref:ABC transporter substrate-binding protein n=1 Tax=Pseudanabaena sp. UWO310 TaxID=2480795 RepID=UPI00115B39E9|nr:ABC transporter substrate-binding protein [Pseudanabaena sp. UWO310]TYQ30502.1 amino acid ABC transporter substrate-binding protein [Pseudanabaena sp. UWO310]